ncbi:MAG: serine hydrolase [Leptospiraceae bacterium]|nr:serine hydrolase [Leptospiraceae bacterium]MCP5501180.1 serine hydrolase [Leptospiraceae bacterium]
MNPFFILFFLLTLFSCSPETELKPYGKLKELKPLKKITRTYWPTEKWRTANPEEKGFKLEPFNKAIEYAFSRQGNEEDRKGIRTDSLIIIKDAYLVFERYERDYTENSLHLLWSVTKSYTQALIGIAVKEGLLSLDEPAYKYYKPLEKKHKDITIRHILNMASGLDADEGYESGPLTSTVVAMLYTRGRNDMGEFCSNLPKRGEPGRYVYYSSCDTNILSAILKSVLKDSYLSFVQEKLFQTIGVKQYSWEADRSGTLIGSSYLYKTPRDVARFAFLYLNQGRWAENQILPENWLTFTRTISPAYKETPYYKGLSEDNMTSQWYTNTGYPERGIPKAWPDADENMIAALGHWGQQIFIFFDRDLIIVRLGDDRDGSFDQNKFLKMILESLQ